MATPGSAHRPAIVFRIGRLIIPPSLVAEAFWLSVDLIQRQQIVLLLKGDFIGGNAGKRALKQFRQSIEIHMNRPSDCLKNVLNW